MDRSLETLVRIQKIDIPCCLKLKTYFFLCNTISMWDILHTKFIKKIIQSKNKMFYLGIRNTYPPIKPFICNSEVAYFNLQTSEHPKISNSLSMCSTYCSTSVGSTVPSNSTQTIFLIFLKLILLGTCIYSSI